MLPLVWLRNYFLTPRFGPMGATASMLLGIAISTAPYRRHGLSSLRLPGAILDVGSGVWAAPLVGRVSAMIPVQAPLLLVKLALLGGLYMLALKALGEITGEDLGLRGTSPADPGT